MLYYLLTDEKNMINCYGGFYVCRTGMNNNTMCMPIVKTNIINNTQKHTHNTIFRYTLLSIRSLLIKNVYIRNIPKYIRFVVCLDKLEYKIFRGYISDNIILSDRHYLYDPKTIKRFNIEVDECYITCACIHGDTKFLEWWKNSYYPLKYDEKALYYTSLMGHIHVLEWWLKSNLPLRYSEKELLKIMTSRGSNIRVLKWWENSGLLKD
jgi:hypothetical protein